MENGLISTIREAGRIILSAHDAEKSVEVKPGEANFVTYYDKAVQEFLFERLGALYPDFAFVGEEEGADDIARLTGGKAFVIDPIDGTTNFMRGFRHSSVSVALCEDGEVRLGAVLNPYTDELFYAEKDKGAVLIGKDSTRALHVSLRPLENGLVLFGTTPYYAETYDETFRILRKLFEASLDVRRIGSAALDLCMIADGRGEAFFEVCLSPWDYAAGNLIVSEAGGIVTRIDGSPVQLNEKGSILAASPDVLRQLRYLLDFQK